jgi:cyclohexyl-isocyanide hydratase
VADDDEQPTLIAMLVYPECTALDLVAPHQNLASTPNSKVDVIAKSRDAVVTDRRLSIVADKSFDDAHEAYDIIMIPGASPPSDACR